MRPVLTLIALCALACSGAEAPMGSYPKSDAEEAWDGDDGAAMEGKKELARKSSNAASAPAGFGGMAPAPSVAPAEPEAIMMDEAPADMEGGPKGDEGGEAATRAWFPETFLFEPSVVTDENGRADHTVAVPDRLTTWRVLALAHDKSGSQAGATTSFLGTLPAYIDPVLPPFLVAGDEVELPIQVVNTTESPLSAPVSISVTGAGQGEARGQVSVPAWASRVQKVRLSAPKPGIARIEARLGNTDAVVREVPVLPSGRPLEQARGGTLATPRSFDILGDPLTDPDSAQVRLAVFPGALAVLRSELAAASSRGGDTAAVAHALLLGGRGGALLTALGDEPDPEALRTLSIVAGQRAIRAARAPDVATAALLAEAAAAHKGNPVLERLGDRLVSTLAASQRPDGTFGGGGGQTVQQMLVITAEATRALQADTSTRAAQQRAAAATLRSSAAFERYLYQVDDPYTAAAILASGAAKGDLADVLKKRVVDAVQVQADGSRILPVPADVVRADGRRPSTVEATALAALALPGVEWRADLGATLLAAYSPSRGWGDGRTDLYCLRAVLELFSEPVPDGVRIELLQDGRLLTSGVLDTKALRDVLVLSAALPDAAGPHGYEVRASPAVPGLGFALTLHTWVPWEEPDTDQGLDMEIELPGDARVGKASAVTLRAIAPAGMELDIEQSLPAGVQPDEASLNDLVYQGLITSFETEDGLVVLHAPGQEPGQVLTLSYRVIPTLAGTLHTTASRLSPTSRPELEIQVPPGAWTVR